MTAHIDGNVLAGALSEVFRADMTTAPARCLGCGHVAPMAEAMVYPDAAGIVVRCAKCDHVLATIVDAGERSFLSFTGMSAIEVPR